jgi:hypothetical protein
MEYLWDIMANVVAKFPRGMPAVLLLTTGGTHSLQSPYMNSRDIAMRSSARVAA